MQLRLLCYSTKAYFAFKTNSHEEVNELTFEEWHHVAIQIEFLEFEFFGNLRILICLHPA